MTRQRDEAILAALDMLRSGVSVRKIAAHFATDERNMGATLRKIKAADTAYSQEDVSAHYGSLK